MCDSVVRTSCECGALRCVGLSVSVSVSASVSVKEREREEDDPIG